MKPLGIIFPQKDQLFAVRFSVNLKLYDLYICREKHLLVQKLCASKTSSIIFKVAPSLGLIWNPLMQASMVK